MNIVEKIQSTKLWHLLDSVEKILMVISTISVVGTLAIVVVCRQILQYNFLGYNEILLIGAFWMYFIGAAHASSEETHIGADILSQFASPRQKVLLSIISKSIQVLLGIPMMYLAFEMLLFDVDTQQATVDLEIPLLLIQTPIFLGFMFMTLYSSLYIVRDIIKLKTTSWEK